MPFPYKTVLVTGATSGIGRALAERMVANGIFVVAVGRRRDRLDELAAGHGPEKLAVEQHDVADLASLEGWAKDITTKYPSLDCIVLNAGVQNTTDFTRALAADDGDAASAAADLAATVASETALNYLSPVQTTAHFLPHLSLRVASGSPAAIVLVSSGLALVPMARCASYCATKAALHSFAWTLRSQLRHHHHHSSGNGRRRPGIRVVEIVPPAVRTELHSRQPDLVAAGLGDFGMALADFTDEAWAGLTADDDDDNEDRDEIIVGPTRDQLHAVEEPRRAAFRHFDKLMRESHNKA